MKQKNKRRLKLLSFKGAGIVTSVALPVWAIIERFPILKAESGTGRMLGIGGLMTAVVLLITFKRTVFDYIKEKTGIRHAPPFAVWSALLIASFAVGVLADAMAELRAVFVAGAVGSGIGTVLSIIGDNVSDKVVEDSREDDV